MGNSRNHGTDQRNRQKVAGKAAHFVVKPRHLGKELSWKNKINTSER
jgi:hypothetical protein